MGTAAARRAACGAVAAFVSEEAAAVAEDAVSDTLLVTEAEAASVVSAAFELGVNDLIVGSSKQA